MLLQIPCIFNSLCCLKKKTMIFFYIWAWVTWSGMTWPNPHGPYHPMLVQTRIVTNTPLQKSINV
jgi:hypothetical protein